MTSDELRREAAELRERGAALVLAAEQEDREITEDENRQLEEWEAEAVRFDRRAETVSRAETTLSHLRSSPGRTSAPLAANGQGGGSIQGGQTEEEKRRSFGDFLRNLALMADNKADSRAREKAHDVVTNFYGSEYRAWDNERASPQKRALAASVGSSGGHTVPTDFYRGIMQVAEESAIVRPRATVIRMEGLSIEIPMLDQTVVPSTGGTAFFGGINLGWTGELEDKPETEPAFRQGTLDAHELSGYTEVTRTLLMKSAISIDGLLYNLFGRAVAWAEDWAFLRGDKPTMPKGVLTSGALVTTAARGSASAISFDNFVSVFVRALASSQGNGVFVASQAAQPAVLKATGTANSIFIPSGFIANTPEAARNGSINVGAFGRPVLISEKLPALNTLGDFGFYDFSNYVIGDPDMGMEIAVSEHYKFRQGRVCFRVLHYVGGMPWLPAPITLADGTTTVSPFVALGTQ